MVRLLRHSWAMIQAKLLIVDDDESFLNLVTAMLEREIKTIETLSRGHDAEQRILDGNYDLVLIDERLSGISGSEIARSVIAKRPRQRCVVITGGKHDIAPIPGVPIIDKPVNPDRLMDAIRGMIGDYGHDGPRTGLRKTVGTLAGFGFRPVGAIGATVGIER